MTIITITKLAATFAALTTESTSAVTKVTALTAVSTTAFAKVTVPTAMRRTTARWPAVIQLDVDAAAGNAGVGQQVQG